MSRVAKKEMSQIPCGSKRHLATRNSHEISSTTTNNRLIGVCSVFHVTWFAATNLSFPYRLSMSTTSAPHSLRSNNSTLSLKLNMKQTRGEETKNPSGYKKVGKENFFLESTWQQVLSHIFLTNAHAEKKDICGRLCHVTALPPLCSLPFWTLVVDDEVMGLMRCWLRTATNCRAE